MKNHFHHFRIFYVHFRGDKKPEATTAKKIMFLHRFSKYSVLQQNPFSMYLWTTINPFKPKYLHLNPDLSPERNPDFGLDLKVGLNLD